jgi:restriction endonuclease S subunit
MRLGDLAMIRTGVFAKPKPGGQVVYLQAKHFDEEGVITDEVRPELKIDESIGKHLLKPGDVLFAAKGLKNFAYVFRGSFPAVASTTFFVSTLIQPGILSDYIVWFLNNPDTLKLIKRQAIGSDIVSISKSVLEKLEVPVASVDDQKRILEIAQLGKREKDLRHEIAELRQLQVQQQIKNAIK